MNYYYIHAYADARRQLPDREAVIQAADEDIAYKRARTEYAEHEEIYVCLCNNEMLDEARREGLLK